MESSPRSHGAASDAGVHLMQLGQRRHHAGDVGRLVSLAAVGHRGEKRAVGFGQQPIERHARAVSRSSAAFGNVTMPASEM